MLGVVVGLVSVTLFLALAVLGSMRETVLLRGEVKALSQLITSPPPPSFVRGRVPDALRKTLQQLHAAPAAATRWLVAFVTPGCGPCQEVATGLRNAVGRGEVLASDLVFVVWASRREASAFASELPGHVLIDDDGDLARSCEVKATPTSFVVSRADFRVLDFDLEGGVEWILDRMRAPLPALPSR